MLVKNVLICAAVAFIIITPIVCFTDLMAWVPYMGPLLTKSFWQSVSSAAEAAPNVPAPKASLAGLVCILFMVYWYLWIQRNKQESILAVVARVQDLHRWLRNWAEVPEQQFEGDIKTMHLKFKKLFRKLDRLVALEDRRNWRWWYTVSLTIFYPLNASKITAFSDVRVEPPVDLWPTPDEASNGLDRSRRRLLQNALQFSKDFTDGAKASTGLNLTLHTIVGGSVGLVLSGFIGGAFGLWLTQKIGVRAGQILLCLTAAVAIGLLAGYCWYWVCMIKAKYSCFGAIVNDADDLSTAVKS